MAAKALAALTRFGEIRRHRTGNVRTFDDVNKSFVENLFSQAKREILSAEDVYNILDAYRIPVADWEIVDDVEDAVNAASKIGFPVVLKADAESIVHKSDVGGVAVNLKDEKEFSTALNEMKEKFKSSDLKFLVQKFLPGGRELIIGAKAEPGLGHLLMFGIGGIFVEVMKDVVFKIAPVTDLEAGEMLSSIKAAKLLTGVRGRKGIAMDAVAEIIQRISQLITDFPQIQEMDLNPLIAYEDKVYAVDARIKI